MFLFVIITLQLLRQYALIALLLLHLKFIWALIGSPLTNQSFLTAKRAWLYLRGDSLFASEDADWLSAIAHNPMRK